MAPFVTLHTKSNFESNFAISQTFHNVYNSRIFVFFVNICVFLILHCIVFTLVTHRIVKTVINNPTILYVM